MSETPCMWVRGRSEAQKIYFFSVFWGWSSDRYEGGLNLYHGPNANFGHILILKLHKKYNSDHFEAKMPRNKEITSRCGWERSFLVVLTHFGTSHRTKASSRGVCAPVLG